MSSFYRSVKKCRICYSSELTPIFSLGVQVLTGVFPKPNQPDPVAVPLDLLLCEQCKFLQLKYTVDPGLMYEEYWYRSGINQTMRDHLAGITTDLKQRMALKADDIIIDIGCNDGTLLDSYQIKGLKRIGVDPSDAILAIKDKEVAKVNDYFSARAVNAHLREKKAKVITAISMFYDLDDPHGFVRDIKSCLAQDGIWVVEMNYTGKMILDIGYDMISHEHVAYYTLRTFEHLVNMHGLYVNDANLNDINGGSIRIFCSLTSSRTPNVEAISQSEMAAGFDKREAYDLYAVRVNEFRTKLVGLVKSIRAEGHTVAAYGASTRGNTFLQHCGFTVDDIFLAADRNPGKWGLETPGTRIPIASEEEVRAAKPDYMLVLPYGFSKEFLSREQNYLQSGGKMIIPLPKLCIYSWNDGQLAKNIV
jgi:hypothetical protein